MLNKRFSYFNGISKTELKYSYTIIRSTFDIFKINYILRVIVSNWMLHKTSGK